MADGSHRFPPPLSLARRQPFDGLRAPAAMSAETPTVEAGLDDVARRDPDAIEAVFRELNAVDEAAAARRYQRLSRKRTVAAEIATLKQKLATAEARIRELEDKDNAFKPLTSWKSDKTKCAPTLDELRECMAALNCEIAKR